MHASAKRAALAALLALLVQAAALVLRRESGGAAGAGHGGRGGLHAPLQCEVADFDGAVRRFSEILQFRTVSDALAAGHTHAPGEFEKLNDWLAAAFPTIWERLTVEKARPPPLSPRRRGPASALQAIACRCCAPPPPTRRLATSPATS
jgi:hypothetical protein